VELHGEVEAAPPGTGVEAAGGARIRDDLGQAGHAGDLQEVVHQAGVAGNEPAGGGQADQRDGGAGVSGAQRPQGGDGAQQVADAGQRPDHGDATHGRGVAHAGPRPRGRRAAWRQSSRPRTRW
jgi:hypothetical protein